MRDATHARQRHSRSSSTNLVVPPAIRRIGMPLVGILVLILASAWMINLEIKMPDIRTPVDPTVSSVLANHGFMTPGVWEIESVDADLTGDWVTQEIGESDWLATDEAGSRIRFAFYGTDLYLTARVGPDASRAYVTVNGDPVEHLLTDDDGSYVGLWAGQASDTPILIARNLAHGEHLVEIIAGEDGELAIAGFDVQASTPLPWAFVLAHAGIAGGMFLIVRYLLVQANRQSSAVIGSRAGRVRANHDSRE